MQRQERAVEIVGYQVNGHDLEHRLCLKSFAFFCARHQILSSRRQPYNLATLDVGHKPSKASQAVLGSIIFISHSQIY